MLIFLPFYYFFSPFFELNWPERPVPKETKRERSWAELAVPTTTPLGAGLSSCLAVGTSAPPACCQGGDPNQR